ncbi:B3 domain-containing protein Os01g0234100 isoform X2 [Helianthus annuus]|uniref:B3 domain-containing protein Os01g0234100 isoform X2 n=1 Tax=Helianthus annuus TaxID=4232 RepID=UPI000B8F4674|nr:B3 domain-containing protein Os01g0234100 isoform X2 [Helianthus annuus]
MAIPHPSPTTKTPLSSKTKTVIKKRLQKKATNVKQRDKKVSFDLASNLIVSYDPKSANLARAPDSKAKSAAIERANEVQASLPSEIPSFVKPMLPSHVTGGFWLGFPKKFCDAHMPKQDETVVLLDENDQEFNTKFLVEKTGLSGGWRGFSIAHNLLEGDALVFQLVDRWKFKVYVVRVNCVNEVDGALALLSLVPCGIKNNSKKIQNAKEMDIDLPEQRIQENSLVVRSDQSSDDSYYSDSPVSEGLRFSQSVLQFKEIKNIDDFSIVVDDLVIDSLIPKHFQVKYYDLCHSQKTYLHENLLKGLNVKLAAGVILETVTIADAIRACKVGVTRDDFDIWDRTLKAFEEMGMKVGFLRGRISKLVGLLFDSNKLLEAKKIEQVKAEDEMRIMSEKLCGIKDVMKNLDAEIETLKLTGKNLELVFCREANAPW